MEPTNPNPVPQVPTNTTPVAQPQAEMPAQMPTTMAQTPVSQPTPVTQEVMPTPTPEATMPEQVQPTTVPSTNEMPVPTEPVAQQVAPQKSKVTTILLIVLGVLTAVAIGIAAWIFLN